MDRFRVAIAVGRGSMSGGCCCGGVAALALRVVRAVVAAVPTTVRRKARRRCVVVGVVGDGGTGWLLGLLLLIERDCIGVMGIWMIAHM